MAHTFSLRILDRKFRSSLTHILIVGPCILLAGCLLPTQSRCTSPTSPPYDLNTATNCGDIRGHYSTEQVDKAKACVEESTKEGQSSYYWTEWFGIEGGSGFWLEFIDMENKRSLGIMFSDDRKTVHQLQVRTWTSYPGEPGEKYHYEAYRCEGP